MTIMSWVLLMQVAEQCFLVERDQDINPVHVRLNLPGRGSHTIVAVFSFDVRVVLYVGKDMETAAGTSFSEGFSNRIDSAPLRAAYNPSEIIFFGQFSYLRRHLLGFLRY